MKTDQLQRRETQRTRHNTGQGALQGSFPKKITLGTPSSSAEAQGSRCGVWVGCSAPHQKNFLTLDLKWANFGANSAFGTVHLQLVSLV